MMSDLALHDVNITLGDVLINPSAKIDVRPAIEPMPPMEVDEESTEQSTASISLIEALPIPEAPASSKVADNPSVGPLSRKHGRDSDDHEKAARKRFEHVQSRPAQTFFPPTTQSKIDRAHTIESSRERSQVF